MFPCNFFKELNHTNQILYCILCKILLSYNGYRTVSFLFRPLLFHRHFSKDFGLGKRLLFSFWTISDNFLVLNVDLYIIMQSSRCSHETFSNIGA